MPIKLKCSCGQALSVPDNLAGKTGKCPKCQKPLQIPKLTAQPTAQATAQPTGAGPASATSKAAPAKSTAATAAAATATKPKPKPTVPVVAAQATNKFDSLLDEVGLTKKTGPVCPKCSAPIRPGSVLCTACGLNFESGEQAMGFEAAAESLEFRNEFLQEAASNMVRDVKMDERREKAGLPWWMLMSYLIGAIILCGAGVVIVDGKFGTPEPAGTPIGKIQRLPVFVVLGITAMVTGQCIHLFAHLSVVVFGFKRGVGPGFGCLFVPFFSYVYAIMNWADNRQAIMAIFMSIVTVSAGIGLIIAGGGFGTLQTLR